MVCVTHQLRVELKPMKIETTLSINEVRKELEERMQFQLNSLATSVCGQVLEARENSSKRDPTELRYVPQNIGFEIIGLPLKIME